MADYWKSQPRKFCQYCKCWIADNKPSRDFHERGKNHKENVAAKFSEIKKKSIEKVKQEERASKEFAAMEEAAMKAYQEDLKRMGREAAGLETPVQPKSTKQPQPLVGPPPKTQQKQQQQPQKKFGKGGKKSGKPPGRRAWLEGQAEGGEAYYYNTETGESRWENPQGARAGGPASAPQQSEGPSSRHWMEAVSPDGYTYYYNTETGESSWERPSDSPPNEPPGSSAADASQEASSAPQPEPPSGEEEERRDGSPAPKPEAGVPERTSQQPLVAKLSFGKRKAEAEPSETAAEDKAGDGAPPEETEARGKEVGVPSAAAEPAEKRERDGVKVAAPAKRPKAANPYGSWERIQEDKEEEDPYANVDLQLPQVAGIAAKATGDLPPEPKPKFRERIITSLGDDGGGGPAAFRRNKAPSGKSRSLRQRDADD